LIAEQKAIEDAKNKKGGKPPAQKAKDPKKMQQEQEEREKALLAKVGVEPIQVFNSPSNNKWVVAFSLEVNIAINN
jgi:golgin subfamily A member 4